MDNAARVEPLGMVAEVGDAEIRALVAKPRDRDQRVELTEPNHDAAEALALGVDDPHTATQHEKRIRSAARSTSRISNGSRAASSSSRRRNT